MRKRLAALAIAAAPIATLTLGAVPAHAASNQYNVAVIFWNTALPGNYCLDIPGNNAVSGEQLQAWACNDSAAQSWNVIYTDSYHFELQSRTNTNLCANNWQGGDNTGNDIKLYTCNGNADGTWNSVHAGSNMQIQPRSALNTCLNIWGGLGSGNPAKLYQCGDWSNEDVMINGVS
ncbi:hypothetical protein ABIA32_000253 [Streptacidiphilus sp. MAP12-20]|uniref:RICIN domain-containing protein n=1 Tax=Streptacidiphilus sp. MAP12-20 TaxID=3156299 RepID=UPI003519D393